MANRNPKPGKLFQKGQSGNPGGRPKILANVQELARAETEANIKTLVQVRDAEDTPAAARIAAANVLLDRGWGKPAQTVNQNIDEKRCAADWSREELVAFLNDGVGR